MNIAILGLLLCLLCSVTPFGHKKAKGKKGGSKKQQKRCGLQYVTVSTTQHRVQCSTEYNTECITSYDSVCRYITATEMIEKCNTVEQPVESCTVDGERLCEDK